MLEIDLPDDTHLEDYAITEEGRQTWEWIVPAALINQSASVSLLTEAEVDEVIASSWC